MSAEDTNAGEKPHDASAKRLEEAREKGQIARSADLIAAAGYAGFLLAAVAFGAQSLREIGTVAMTLLDQSERLAPLFLGGSPGVVAGLLWSLCVAAAPWFLLPALCALLCVLAQRALLFTGENLSPRLSRISPLANAGHKFGIDGLFEFFKSAVKLSIFSVILGMFLWSRMPPILMSLHLTPAMAMVSLMELLVEFLALVLVISAAIGAVDYLWQRFQHHRRNRMSRQDLVDEQRLTEGDPNTKQIRRKRGYTIAMNQMLAEVPKSDVVIVNPEHYAVALKWNRLSRGAPVCVAKGVDDIAAAIRAAAAQAGVPIHRDAPTARALFATVDLGDEIPPEQYRAVAAAIRFAERMRKKAGRGYTL